jgi:hypothetical protein
MPPQELLKNYRKNSNLPQSGRVKHSSTPMWTLQPIIDYQIKTPAE